MTDDIKKNLRDKIKARQKHAAKQRNDASQRKSSAEVKNIDYDLLPAEEQQKYFAPDGTCQFQELTGETRYPQFIIDRAFDIYLEGTTLESVGVKLNIPLSTIQRWSTTQNWAHKIERFKTQVAEQHEKGKVKEAVQKRKKVDDKHEKIVNWLQMEIQWEMNKPYPIEATDEKSQFLFETRRNLRMKTWAITANSMKTLIELERMVVGMDQEIEKESMLPTHFTFELAMPNGSVLNGLEDLRMALPSQNPYGYDPLALNAGASLSAATTPQIEDKGINPSMVIPAPPSQTSQASDPFVRATNMPKVGGENKRPLDPIVIPDKVGHNENPAGDQAIKPHPVFGYLNMGINMGTNRQF